MPADPALPGPVPSRRLAVLVLNWRSGPDTVACVRAVEGWRRLRPTVWVVDNASGDGSAELVRAACPGARLIAAEVNRGFAGGNNLALVPALEDGADFVLLLNNDAAVEEATVVRLLASLEADSTLGLVGPLLLDEHEGAGRLSAGGRDIARHVVSHVPGEAAQAESRADGLVLRAVEYVPGTVVLIRADTLRAVGLLDEAYFFGGELADLCTRARDLGYGSAVDLEARATHSLDRSSLLRDRLHAYYILRNRFLYIRKFRPRNHRLLYAGWIAYGAGLVVANLLRGRPLTARALGLGLVDGVRGRFGGQNDRVLA